MPHRCLTSKIHQAPITPATPKPHPSSAIHRLSRDPGLDYVYRQTGLSHGTLPENSQTSNLQASITQGKITVSVVSPASSQESLPEFVYDSISSDNSTDIQTSSDDESIPTHPTIVEHNTNKPHYTASNVPPASFVPFRPLAARVQAKTSPMYAPKLITDPALKSRDEKPAAVLKRSMWKLKAKRRTRCQGQRTQVLTETQSSSSISPLPLPTCASLNVTSPSPGVVESVPPSTPPVYDTASTPDLPLPEFEGYQTLPPLHHAPFLSPQQVEASTKLTPQPPVGLFPARTRVPTFSKPAAPESMTPKELAAAMSQHTTKKRATPQAIRPVSVYMLMDAARTIVPKGGVIPPKTQYQVKDGKGTWLRMTGPKGLKV